MRTGRTGWTRKTMLLRKREDLSLYERPHRIILDHERQHRPQIEEILRRPGK